MRRRYVLAIIAQVGAYGFVVFWLLAMLKLLPATSQVGFFLIVGVFMPCGILPLFLRCERCRENYFYDERTAKRWGSFSMHRGYNLLIPVKETCQKCGLDRFRTTDRDPV